jgi:hypothetical protein
VASSLLRIVHSFFVFLFFILYFDVFLFTLLCILSWITGPQPLLQALMVLVMVDGRLWEEREKETWWSCIFFDFSTHFVKDIYVSLDASFGLLWKCLCKFATKYLCCFATVLLFEEGVVQVSNCLSDSST